MVKIQDKEGEAVWVVEEKEEEEDEEQFEPQECMTTRIIVIRTDTISMQVTRVRLATQKGRIIVMMQLLQITKGGLKNIVTLLLDMKYKLM